RLRNPIEQKRTKERDELDHENHFGQVGHRYFQFIAAELCGQRDDGLHGVAVEQKSDQESQGLWITAHVAQRNCEFAEAIQKAVARAAPARWWTIANRRQRNHSE